VRVGLFDRAWQSDLGQRRQDYQKLALGELMLADGHPEAAIPHLENGPS
jgi:hypothetical protein